MIFRPNRAQRIVVFLGISTSSVSGEAVRRYISAATLVLLAVVILSSLLSAYTWSNSSHIVSTGEWICTWLNFLVAMVLAISSMAVFDFLVGREPARAKVMPYLVLLVFVFPSLAYVGISSGMVYIKFFG